MFRFNKINNHLYKYRDVNVKIWLDGNESTSMLIKLAEDSEECIQFYAHGLDFEEVKQTIINRIDEHLEESSNGHS